MLLYSGLGLDLEARRDDLGGSGLGLAIMVLFISPLNSIIMQDYQLLSGNSKEPECYLCVIHSFFWQQQ